MYKENKGIIIAISILTLFLVSGCEKPIGGETDEHGCMLMAGYSWCEAKQKCLRSWEEDCYTSIDQCNSDCTAKGYDEGGCKWPQGIESVKDKEGESLGFCYIENSKHCGNKGQCTCYCIKEIN